jgi:hypothetical protein
MHGSWRDRLRASAIHFCISLAVAAVAGLLVFIAWYPWPFREISGGRELFLILVGVDVALGPLITFAVFNRAKGWKVLRRDFVVIGLLQLSALFYGMYTAYVARPVYVVFEYDRFRVVHAIDIPKSLLSQAPEGLRSMPMFGPKTLGLRQFMSPDEKLSATIAALDGLSLSARPELWIPYGNVAREVLAAAKPIAPLKSRFPDRAAAIDDAVRKSGRAGDKLVYVPMIGRMTFWTALVDPATTEIVGYIPLDPY